MSTATGQQQRAGYEQIALDKARRDPGRTMIWSQIMEAAGHRVGAHVSARDLHFLLEEKGLLPYSDPQARSAQFKLLVEEGFLAYAKDSRGRSIKVKSPAVESGNANHDVYVFVVVKVFRTADEMAAYRARLAEQREADRRLADRVAVRTARVRASRGLGSSAIKALA